MEDPVERFLAFTIGVLLGVGASVVYYRHKLWAFVNELEASRKALRDAVNRAKPKE
jgi:hypothetical protein